MTEASAPAYILRVSAFPFALRRPFSLTHPAAIPPPAALCGEGGQPYSSPSTVYHIKAQTEKNVKRADCFSPVFWNTPCYYSSPWGLSRGHWPLTVIRRTGFAVLPTQTAGLVTTQAPWGLSRGHSPLTVTRRTGFAGQRTLFAEHRLRCGSKKRFLADFTAGSEATSKICSSHSNRGFEWELPRDLT